MIATLNSGGSRGVSRVSTEPPFGLDLVLRSTEMGVVLTQSGHGF